MKGSEGGILARFDKLRARMAAVNAKHSEEEVGATLKAATKELRRKR